MGILASPLVVYLWLATDLVSVLHHSCEHDLCCNRHGTFALCPFQLFLVYSTNQDCISYSARFDPAAVQIGHDRDPLSSDPHDIVRSHGEECLLLTSRRSF